MGKQDLEKHPAIIKLKKEEKEASRRFNEEVKRDTDRNQAFIHIVFWIICIIGIGGTIYSWLFGSRPPPDF